MEKQLEFSGTEFSEKESKKLRDESIDMVERPALGWIELAIPHVIAIAKEVNDRVEYELSKASVPPPREKRAMGALMRKVSRLGYIVKTNRTYPSVMPSNHRRPKAIWKSLITSWMQPR